MVSTTSAHRQHHDDHAQDRRDDVHCPANVTFEIEALLTSVSSACRPRRAEIATALLLKRADGVILSCVARTLHRS